MLRDRVQGKTRCGGRWHDEADKLSEAGKGWSIKCMFLFTSCFLQKGEATLGFPTRRLDVKALIGSLKSGPARDWLLSGSN